MEVPKVRRGKLSRLVADPAAPALLRAEIWVDPGVLEAAGFAAGPQGRVAFAASLGEDLCFFTGPDTVGGVGPGELAKLAHAADLDCGMAVDGPFQRLASTGPLLDLLSRIGRDPAGFGEELGRQMEAVDAAVGRIATAGVDLLLVTDDIAYAGGLYFSPELFRLHLFPLYRDLIARYPAADLVWGWHSDGRVMPLLADLVTCGFKVFSLEAECVDLHAFQRAYCGRACLIGGIRAAWLAAEGFDASMRAACAEEIGALIGEGGIILASSCGIHAPGFLSNLREIYRVAEAFPTVGA
jgi:hypothetical protein